MRKPVAIYATLLVVVSILAFVFGQGESCYVMPEGAQRGALNEYDTSRRNRMPPGRSHMIFTDSTIRWTRLATSYRTPYADLAQDVCGRFMFFYSDEETRFHLFESILAKPAVTSNSSPRSPPPSSHPFRRTAL